MAASMAQMCSRRILQNSHCRGYFKGEVICLGSFCSQKNSLLMGIRRVITTSKIKFGSNLNFNKRKFHSNCASTVAPDTKLLKVAIIGEPNSGKSTLINQLVGEKIVAVTEKPHTTRQVSRGVFTSGGTQIILLDTPGLVTQSEGKRLKMTREHIKAPGDALDDADIIGVICDASNKRTRDRIHQQVLQALEQHVNIPSFLILNKIDKLRHKVDLLVLAAELSKDRGRDEWGYTETGGWSEFDNVFMVSARLGNGVQDLREYLVLRATPSDWLYPPDCVTDMGLESRVTEVFREKMLELYEHEIPWQVKQVPVLCELREGNKLRIHQKLYCRKKSQRKCVLEKVETLETLVKKELQEMFNCELDLSLDVGLSEKIGFKTPLPSY
ncbi:predicted protein [Nematostella vectensis]|uniref:GTPase Era, mitochondrial n=1 Tax=Nematostella vectensis TaxID=45351 RepID=A7S8A8_NEMVE|nr:predicted protein [Nematostella vectensis]|eukprot:XP_001632135.1 predicted protein [Nematostella vectensis]